MRELTVIFSACGWVGEHCKCLMHLLKLLGGLVLISTIAVRVPGPHRATA